MTSGSTIDGRKWRYAPRAEEAARSRRRCGCARRAPAPRCEQLQLGERVGQVERGVAVLRRDVVEQLRRRRGADRREHRCAVVVGQRDVRVWVSVTSRCASRGRVSVGHTLLATVRSGPPIVSGVVRRPPKASQSEPVDSGSASRIVSSHPSPCGRCSPAPASRRPARCFDHLAGAGANRSETAFTDSISPIFSNCVIAAPGSGRST